MLCFYDHSAKRLTIFGQSCFYIQLINKYCFILELLFPNYNSVIGANLILLWPESTLYILSLLFNLFKCVLWHRIGLIFRTFMGSLRRAFVVVKQKHPQVSGTWRRLRCFQVLLIFMFACTLLKLSSLVFKLPGLPFVLSWWWYNGQVLLGN